MDGFASARRYATLALVVSAYACSAPATAGASAQYSYLNSITGFAPPAPPPAPPNPATGPQGVAYHDGALWVTDTVNDKVDQYTSGGALLASYGAAGTGDGQFATPRQADVFPTTHFIDVADTFNTRVQQLDGSGAWIKNFNFPFNGPRGLALDPASGLVAVADAGSSEIDVFDADGTLVRAMNPSATPSATFQNPEGVAFDPAGHLWVADTGANRVQEFDSNAVQMQSWTSTHLSSPTGIAVDASGNVFIANWGSSTIEQFDSAGGHTSTIASSGSTPGAVSGPVTVALDQASGDLFVADERNNRVERFVVSGSPTPSPTPAPTPTPSPTPTATPSPAPSPAPQSGVAMALGLTGVHAFNPPSFRVVLDFRAFRQGQQTGAIVLGSGTTSYTPHPTCLVSCHYWPVTTVITVVDQLRARGIYVNIDQQPGRKSFIDDPYAAHAALPKPGQLTPRTMLVPGSVYRADPLRGAHGSDQGLPPVQIVSEAQPGNLSLFYWDEARDPIIHQLRSACPYEKLAPLLTAQPESEAIRTVEALKAAHDPCDVRFKYKTVSGYGVPRVQNVLSKRDNNGKLFAEAVVIVYAPPPPPPPAPATPPENVPATNAVDLALNVESAGSSQHVSFDRDWTLPSNAEGIFNVAVSDRAVHFDAQGRPFSVFISHADVDVQFAARGSQDYRSLDHFPTGTNGTATVSVRPPGPGTIRLEVTVDPASGAILQGTTSFPVTDHGKCIQEAGGRVYTAGGFSGYQYSPTTPTCPGVTAAAFSWGSLIDFFKNLLTFDGGAQRALSASGSPVSTLARNSAVNIPGELSLGGPMTSNPVPGQIIAAGSGNVIAAGSGNIIGAGSGNIIGAGSGNYAASSSSLVSVPGGTMLTVTSGIIGAGSGNIIGAGSGNLGTGRPAAIIGAGSGNVVDARTAPVIAAGSGNIIAAGSGNIIAAGSGNIIAAGSGNAVATGGFR